MKISNELYDKLALVISVEYQSDYGSYVVYFRSGSMEGDSLFTDSENGYPSNQ